MATLDQHLQTQLNAAESYLVEAKANFENSDFNESERCAIAALDRIEKHANRDDLGEEKDVDSQLYAVVYKLAHAYNRLFTIYKARGELRASLVPGKKALELSERIGYKSRIADMHGNIANTLADLGDFDQALQYNTLALELHKETGNTERIAWLYAARGAIYGTQSDFQTSLELHDKALGIFTETGDEKSIAAITGNIGITYWNLREYQTALEHLHKSLAFYESRNDKMSIARTHGNLGLVYKDLGDFASALEHHGTALALNKELGVRAGVARNVGNIGSVYVSLHDYPRALEFLTKAHSLCEEVGEKVGTGRNMLDIGRVYSKEDFEGYDTTKAEEYLRRALVVFEEIGEKQYRYQCHKELAELFENQQRWEEFALHYKQYHKLEREVQSEEATRVAQRTAFERKAAERDKQRAAEQAAADARISEQQNLLHRMLPAQVADRLLRGERVADYFEKVSILFADIVGFTPIAARMPARDVIAFLNYVFSEFDAVIKKHGCEKIKTIGDGYMAVAGAPLECNDHAERLARAAVEMMNDIQLPDDIRKTLPRTSTFHIRIGLHCGSAFGGIVGNERFVYDIYSDAVNLASRMESSGEPGRIHCSEEFAYHLQNRDSRDGAAPVFHFEERGEIEVKGKGMMRTYFLEKA